jgi:hypothetical protein
MWNKSEKEFFFCRFVGLKNFFLLSLGESERDGEEEGERDEPVCSICLNIIDRLNEDYTITKCQVRGERETENEIGRFTHFLLFVFVSTFFIVDV